METTFGTKIHNYSYQGKQVYANTGQLSLPAGTPAAVTGAINGIIGIDQGSELKQTADTEPGPPPGARFGVQPCSAYYGQKVATDKPAAYGKHQPYAVCGYTPAQLQSAYGESSLIKQGIDGRGVTVAITDAYAAPTILKDAQKYNQVHGQPLFKPGQFSQITPEADGYDNTDLCGAQGWYGEETLDVEAVHAMAPGAKIIYVGAPDCLSGLDQAWANIIDSHFADVVTNSWTDGIDDITLLGNAYVTFYEQFSTEAAHHRHHGQLLLRRRRRPHRRRHRPGVQDRRVPGRPALRHRRRRQQRVHRPQGPVARRAGLADRVLGAEQRHVGLRPVYSSGGGGGTSQLFTQPWYQQGKVPTSESEYYSNVPMRTVPDIAMDADPNTGMIVGETQVFPDGTYWDQYRIGGTSLASPLLAGVVAVADQAHHKALGFINPLYYSMIGTSALHDIVAPKSPLAQVRTEFVNGVDNKQGKLYKLQTIDVQTTTIHDGPGYDDETGVGTPAGPAFFTRRLAEGRTASGPGDFPRARFGWRCCSLSLRRHGVVDRLHVLRRPGRSRPRPGPSCSSCRRSSSGGRCP